MLSPTFHRWRLCSSPRLLTTAALTVIARTRRIKTDLGWCLFTLVCFCHHRQPVAASDAQLLLYIDKSACTVTACVMDWIGLCSVLRPRQHSKSYMGDGFCRSKDPTNSIKVPKEMLQRTNQTTKTTKYTCTDSNRDKKDIHKISTTKSPSLH